MRIRDWSSDVCSSDLGTGPTPFNAEGGVRVSTASAYLGADVRRRPNLTILANRAEERRVGHECVSTCRYRWSPDHQKKTNETYMHRYSCLSKSTTETTIINSLKTLISTQPLL